MSSHLSSKILSGAWVRPILLSELSFPALESGEVLEVFKILSHWKLNPPELYYHISTHILSYSNQRYSTYSLILQDISLNSFTDLSKSLFRNYNRLKPVKRDRLQFSEQECVEIIQVLAELSYKEEYQETSYELIKYFCDRYCSNEYTPSTQQAQNLLDTLIPLHLKSVECEYLIMICRAVLSN